jgi:heat shock protein HslJ
MKTITKLTLLGLVLLALAACQLLPRREATADLADTSWVLSSLDGNLPLPGTTVTLQFGADGVASGSDGCNRFRTTFSQDGTGLTFDQPGASTMMACPQPVMDQAAVFMAALVATESFTADERDLILSDGDRIVATFVASSQDLAETVWDVISYNNGREAVVGVMDGTEISASFGADGQVSGNAGCNQYSASYSVDGNAIEIGPAATTFMFCAEPTGVMEQESEYLAALASAATYRIEGDLLEMRTAADQIAVMMTRKSTLEPPAPTVEAPTAVVPPTSAPGATATPLPPSTATPTALPPTATPTPLPPTATPSAQISFWADRTSIEQGQCTTLRWSVEHVQAVWVYPQGEQYHRFPRAGQGSEQVCLLRTTTYEMRVLLRDGSTTFREVTINVAGPPPPTVAPSPVPNPLAGTRWEVVNYNNGRGALVSVLDNTRIALDFGTDGQITGNAGCNNYFGYYQLSGNNITIGQPANTSLTCAEPEGVMEQEAEFLATLQTAATFRIDGDMLEVRSADQVAIIARRVP